MDYQDFINERRAKQFPDWTIEVLAPEEIGSNKVEGKAKKKSKKGE